MLQCVQRQGAVVQPPQPAHSSPASGASPAGHPRLEVVYEDEHMACVVKPPGIPVDMPSGRAAAAAAAAAASAAQGTTAPSSSRSRSSGAPQLVSVYTLLAHSLQPTQQLGAMRRPRHAHRLDEPTGGLLLVGKTRGAQAALCAAFERRQVGREGRSGHGRAGMPVLESRAWLESAQLESTSAAPYPSNDCLPVLPPCLLSMLYRR